MMLVARAMPVVEERLLQVDKTMLMIYPGLLARYDQMEFLEPIVPESRAARRNPRPLAAGAWRPSSAARRKANPLDRPRPAGSSPGKLDRQQAPFRVRSHYQ